MSRVIPALIAALLLMSEAQAQGPSQPDVERILREALEDPFNEVRFEAYLATLPQDEGYYIVEGDIALNRDEVRTDLVARSAAPALANSAAELLLSVHEGRRSFYESPAERNLTYSVDRGSFPSEELYRTVLDNFRQAAAEWESLCASCGIRFIQTDSGGAPTEKQPFFLVRYHNARGAYIARAFFPHHPAPRRMVLINPSYFSTKYDQVGVLRHELGHVLDIVTSTFEGSPAAGKKTTSGYH